MVRGKPLLWKFEWTFQDNFNSGWYESNSSSNLLKLQLIGEVVLPLYSFTISLGATQNFTRIYKSEMASFPPGDCGELEIH